MSTTRPFRSLAAVWEAKIYRAECMAQSMDCRGFGDDAYEVTIDGAATGVIELPIERILDDAPYFGAASGSLPSPELVDQIYRAEFDVAYQEGGLYVLTMHPHYTGHRSRVLWLERLIAYMKSKPGVWFATHEEVATYVKKAAEDFR